MAHISREDRRRYAEAHASTEPADIYDPDGAASGQYFMDKYGTGPREAPQQEASGTNAEADAVLGPSTGGELAWEPTQTVEVVEHQA
ncbi:hypothetical protein BVC93_31465 (plasmid) [Mycobacterium sp. MS1601]|uniref:hypothetical protein n=1 Tax=Mycobacterium sp. MS1601 TaxID=1936029 RepID=UPI0009795848|nr:hypothetical protein [Mycobacterium sp. MS1601]AQA07015.1 hypothetical protein BVC93_31465 [Mycobacterium sp. MS1601]